MTTTTNERKKRNMKCLAYVVVGIIAQTAIVLLFALLIMRIRNPKVRLASISIETLNVNSSSSFPSFKLKFNALVTVKNTNFGHFKFDNSTTTFSYRGTHVGEGTIIKARARARSTKKLNVTNVSLNSNMVSSLNYSKLRSDLSSKSLTFSAYAKLNGKIHLLKIFKKKKSAEFDCTFVVDTSTKAVHNLSCK